MTEALPAIAVLGGTGSEGWGLALRWAIAGYPVIIGSRSAERAAEAASAIEAAASEHIAPSDLDFDRAELARRLARPVAETISVRGMANSDAAEACQIAVLTVPFAAQKSTVEEARTALTGKILVDVTVPLVPPKVLRVQLPDGGSAVAAIQDFLGEDVRVVSAFQNITAAHLKDLDHDINCDVLVCGFTGCCDASTNKHTMKHCEETGHAIVRSAQPGESWLWCYPDKAFLSSRHLAGKG